MGGYIQAKVHTVCSRNHHDPV